jgi:polysaccharide export outer membrane protein
MKINTTTIINAITGGFIHHPHPVRLMLGLMSLLVFAGCQTPAPENRSAGEPLAGHAGAATLREGDVLKITFPGTPNLDTTQAIRSDGKLILPVVGEVAAAGMTPAGMETDLLNRYSSQLLSKEVRVAVETSSFVVYVTGAVLRPGKIVSARPLSAIEAIMEAGGPDYTKANLKKVSVTRLEAGQFQTYTLDLKPTLEGKAGKPFYLQPSDIIKVPERFVWF